MQLISQHSIYCHVTSVSSMMSGMCIYSWYWLLVCKTKNQSTFSVKCQTHFWGREIRLPMRLGYPGSIAWQVKLSSAWLSHCQDSGELSGSTSVCPVPHTLSKHCSYTNKTWKFVLRLDCCISTEYSMRALYSTGSSSPLLWIGPSTDCKTKVFYFSVLLLWYLLISSKLAVGRYIHSLSQIYTPDSAIYSHGCNCREYITESGVYMPYMMPCGTFHLPTHKYIYTILTTTYGSIFNLFPHFGRVDTARKVIVVTSNSLPSLRRSHRDHCHPGQPYHLPSIYMEVATY